MRPVSPSPVSQWSLPSYWTENWHGEHLIKALLEKRQLNRKLVQLLCECPNDVTSMHRLIHLILSNISENYLLQLNSEWRYAGYDVLTRLPCPLPPPENVNQFPPHQHADLQLICLGIGIDFNQDQRTIISRVLNLCVEDERKLIDALTILENRFPKQVFDELETIFFSAICDQDPFLTKEKALYFIKMKILPLLSRENFFPRVLEKLLEEKKDENFILETLALYHAEFSSLTEVFVAKHKNRFRALEKIRTYLVEYLAKKESGSSKENSFELFLEDRSLTESELLRIKPAITLMLQVILTKPNPVEILRSVHASRDTYLNFNESDFYPLGHEDVLAAEAYLAREHQELLTNFNSAIVFEDKKELYTLLPLGGGLLMPPHFKNEEYHRFLWLVQYLRQQVCCEEDLKKPIHFIGVFNWLNTHYITYILTKMQDSSIVIHLIDPSARSHREPSQCAKRSNVVKINDALTFIFPGCKIVHLPFDQMLEGRNCGFHAYHNLDIILQAAKKDDPVIVIDETMGVSFNLAMAPLFYRKTSVQLFQDGKIFQSQSIVLQSQEIRHQWLDRLARPENSFALECKENAIIFNIYSGVKFPLSPLMRRMKEYKYDHEERDKLVKDLREVCGDLFSVEKMLQIFNSGELKLLPDFIEKMIQRIKSENILSTFKLAIQYTNVTCESFFTQSRYMLASVYEEKITVYFETLLASLSWEEVQNQSSLDAFFRVFLEKNQLMNFFHYLSPKMHCKWRDLFQKQLDHLMDQKYNEKILAVVQGIVHHGVAQFGAHFTVENFYVEFAKLEYSSDQEGFRTYSLFSLRSMISRLNALIQGELENQYKPLLTAIFDAFHSDFEQSCFIDFLNELTLDVVLEKLSNQEAPYIAWLKQADEEGRFISDLRKRLRLNIVDEKCSQLFPALLEMSIDYLSKLSEDDDIFSADQAITEEVLLPRFETLPAWQAMAAISEPKEKFQEKIFAELKVKLKKNRWIANFQYNVKVLLAELKMLLKVMQLENIAEHCRSRISCQINSLVDFEKSLKNSADCYTESQLRGLSLKIQNDLIANFRELLQVWQRGDLKPGRFNSVFRKTATILFATTQMVSQFNRLLDHLSVEKYDSDLLKCIHVGFPFVFIENRLNPKRVIPLSDLDLQVMPFGINDSISKESILRMILFWYSRKGNMQEPTELLQLKHLAFTDSATLVGDLKEFLKKNYLKAHDPLLRDMLLHLTFAKEFQVMTVVSPLKIDMIEMILYCYDQREMPSSIQSPAEKMYFQCMMNRSMSFTARFFGSDPESIKALRQLCQQFKRFRNVNDSNFEFNIFERDLLLDLVLKQKLLLEEEPNATDACYLLVGYALARSLDQDPRYLFGRQEQPGRFEDAASLPLHLVKQPVTEIGCNIG